MERENVDGIENSEFTSLADDVPVGVVTGPPADNEEAGTGK